MTAHELIKNNKWNFKTNSILQDLPAAGSLDRR